MKQLYLLQLTSIQFSRKALVLFLNLFFFSSLSSQTTNISGIVNTYHRVIEIIPSRACVRVADVTGLDINSYILIVQMKGASVDLSATSAFGSVTAMNQAGMYEVGAICSISDDSVFLFHNLLNNYDIPNGKVQLVQFGQYYAANVTDSVKALPWDSAAGTGGVIALFADQDITLNAPVSADAVGYAGGIRFDHTGNCNPIVGTGYFYNPSAADPTNGAYKGEGIADIPSASYLGGRGAFTNGGGGGNNHNNSGGGGANASAGGLGGRNSSSGPFNCNLNNNSGIGGYALSTASGTRLFMGGGGGAGHANNGSAPYNYGGKGGGIVFIWATNIWGADTISANGANGGPSTSDGAGGGGGGGTIILQVNNFASTVVLEANGGNGGNSDNSAVSNRCFGGGGGGSGGVIYFSGPVQSNAFVGGGSAGVESNSLGTCSSRPGVPGTAGSTVSGYVFTRSADPSGYCSTLLPVELLRFTAVLYNEQVLLNWEIATPSTLSRYIIERSVDAMPWTAIGAVNSDDNIHSYHFTDAAPPAGKLHYRIRFVETNNQHSFSPVRQVIHTTIEKIVVYPNPAQDKIRIGGEYKLPALVRLIDLQGKILVQQTIHQVNTTIDLSHLPAGIYLLWVNSAVVKITRQ